MINSISEITYRQALPEDFQGISDLMREMNWTKSIADHKRFSRMIENSDRTVIALEDSRIVGFAKAICDDEVIGYISSVAVSPEMQGKGIGSALVKILIGDNPDIKWVITPSATSRLFWEKHGFKILNSAMEKPREADTPPSKPSPIKKINTFERYIDSPLRKIYRAIRAVFMSK